MIVPKAQQHRLRLVQLRQTQQKIRLSLFIFIGEITLLLSMLHSPTQSPASMHPSTPTQQIDLEFLLYQRCPDAFVFLI